MANRAARHGTSTARHYVAWHPTMPCCLGPPCPTLGPGTALCLLSRAHRHGSPPWPCRPVAAKEEMRSSPSQAVSPRVTNTTSLSHSSAPLRPRIVATSAAPSQRCLAQTPSSRHSSASRECRAAAVVAAPRGEDEWGRSGVGLPAAYGSPSTRLRRRGRILPGTAVRPHWICAAAAQEEKVKTGRYRGLGR